MVQVGCRPLHCNTARRHGWTVCIRREQACALAEHALAILAGVETCERRCPGVPTAFTMTFGPFPQLLWQPCGCGNTQLEPEANACSGCAATLPTQPCHSPFRAPPLGREPSPSQTGRSGGGGVWGDRGVGSTGRCELNPPRGHPCPLFLCPATLPHVRLLLGASPACCPALCRFCGSRRTPRIEGPLRPAAYSGAAACPRRGAGAPGSGASRCLGLQVPNPTRRSSTHSTTGRPVSSVIGLRSRLPA